MIKSEHVANLVEQALRSITEEMAAELRSKAHTDTENLLKNIGVKNSYDKHMDERRTRDYWKYDNRTFQLMQGIRERGNR